MDAASRGHRSHLAPYHCACPCLQISQVVAGRRLASFAVTCRPASFATYRFARRAILFRLRAAREPIVASLPPTATDVDRGSVEALFQSLILDGSRVRAKPAVPERSGR